MSSQPPKKQKSCPVAAARGQKGSRVKIHLWSDAPVRVSGSSECDGNQRPSSPDSASPPIPSSSQLSSHADDNKSPRGEEHRKACPPLTRVPRRPGASQEFSLMRRPWSKQPGEPGSWAPGTQVPESTRQSRPSPFTRQGEGQHPGRLSTEGSWRLLGQGPEQQLINNQRINPSLRVLPGSGAEGGAGEGGSQGPEGVWGRKLGYRPQALRAEPQTQTAEHQ